MINARRLLPFLALFSIACGLVVPVPTPTPLPATATQTASPTNTTTATPDISVTQTIAVALTQISYTATPTFTVTPEFNPENLVESEQSLAPPALSPGASYELLEEVIVGPYGIRFWKNTNDPMSFSDIIMIDRAGIDSVFVQQGSAIHPLTGTDLNGDKIPEAVIETYSGGAHCCFGTQVYNLGSQPQLILKKPESNTGGQFEDLDEDGTQEFVTYDDVFAYQYCPYAGSPFAKSILIYDPAEQLYKPASPLFADTYTESIVELTENAEQAGPGDYGEWDDSNKCGVLPMVLAQIYSGDTKTARSELERVYANPDINDFWNELLLIIQNSPLYTPGSSK